MRISDIKLKKKPVSGKFRSNPAAVKLAGMFLVLTVLVTGFWFALQTMALNPPAGDPPEASGSVLDAASGAPANSIYIGSVGDVGFSNTDPVYKLDVGGDVNFTGTLYQNGSPISTSTKWSTSGSNVYYSTGYVGIGSGATNPQASLDIGGNLRLVSAANAQLKIPNGYLDVYPTGTTHGLVLRNSSATTYAGLRTVDSGSSDRLEFAVATTGYGSGLVLAQNNRVGIGTTTPAAKVHVVQGDPTYALYLQGGSDYPRMYFQSATAGMDNIADMSFVGTAGDGLGGDVAAAGDVNNDGYPDVIVGASGAGVGGEAYIYFGGPSMDTTPDVTIAGASGAGLGYAVAGACNVNGDAYADVLVSTGEQVSGDIYGKVRIYYGGNPMNNVTDVTLNGTVFEGGFGYDIACAGDMNNDTYDDVIVAEGGHPGGGVARGRAYIYLGGSSMNNGIDLTFSGAADYDGLGIDVSSAGNVNGDAYDDVIVGVFESATRPPATWRGKAYIYYGGATLNNVADVTLTGTVDTEHMGFAVSYGNINGDAYSDVLVGTRQLDTGPGHVYVYYGGATMNNVVDITLTGESSCSGGSYCDDFGNYVSSGSFNGDAYDDVIVSAPSALIGGLWAGKAYIYFGAATMNTVADVTMSAEASFDGFGSGVAGIGDVNNDTYGDAIVGAEYSDTGGSQAGKAYVYYGAAGTANPAGIWNREGNKEFFFGEDSDSSDWVFRGSGTFGVTGGKLAIGTDQVPASYRLYANGSMYSTGGWQSSDQRLKENITPLLNVSEKLEHLTGVSFDWKVSQFPNKGLPQGTQLGLIAQEVEQEFPELINYDNEGYKTLSYNGFSAILVQAFKELKHRLDTLEFSLNQSILTLQELTSRKITVETAVLRSLQLVSQANGETYCLGIENGQRVVKMTLPAGGCE